ncbi:MAG: helicase-related protein, partial [Promethearchaeia archaeon]
QHAQSCEDFLKISKDEIIILNGKVKPIKRVQLFKESKIIISTPQVIKNDIELGRYDIARVTLLIFDEAHRTRGNYAYNFISHYYIQRCKDPQILGLTASPGKNQEIIQDVCNNLFVENIISKTRDDADIQKYIHDIDLFLEYVDLPIEIVEIAEVWKSLFNKFLQFFIDRDLINPFKRYYSKLDFLAIAKDLTLSLKFEEDEFIEPLEREEYLEQLYYQEPKIIDIVREKNLNIYSIFSYCSSCISLLHGKDLLETQDISLFSSFLEKIERKAGNDIKAGKRITHSEHYKLIESRLSQDSKESYAHPKINKVFSLIHEELKEYQNKKILIFTQYREMAEELKQLIAQEFEEKLKVEKFIGQASKIDDPGFSQSTQIKILEKFRKDKIDILIATSVAEEGLDIPNIDALIFYEPVPSEIRFIQRRGRTGRSKDGRCYILLTKDTVDVPFFKVAKKKEGTMNKILENPEKLNLHENLERKKIDFSLFENTYSQYEVIKNFRERKEKEKKLLADRSLEEIIENLDKFCNSKQYNSYKNHGVTFFNDVADLSKEKLKSHLYRIKNIKNSKKKKKKRKRYLNHNVKTLIDLVKYSEEKVLNLEKFKKFASAEDICDRKFYIHFNRACYLEYLKKEDGKVVFLKGYD